MNTPRIFTISESRHRIHSPFTEEKYVTSGRVLHIKSETRILDLGSDSGEMLYTRARSRDITETGIDMSSFFTTWARRHTGELSVSEHAHFIHNDVAGYVANEEYGVAACVGVTRIAGGSIEAVELLVQSLRPGGTMLIGEPY